MAATSGGRLAPRLLSLAALGVDLLSWNWDGLWRWGGVELTPTLDAVAIACLVLAHLPAVLCPERVWPVAATLWVYGVLIGLAGSDFSPFAGLCVALARLAAVVSLPLAAAALVAVAVPFGLNAVNTTAEVGAVADPLLLTVPIWAALAVIPWGIGRASYRAAERAEEQAREREQLKETEARDHLQSERLRLARELHDIVSHSVSAMMLQAAGARALAPEGDPRQLAALEAVEQTGVQAMRELHRLLGLLRSADDADTAESEATRWYGQESVHDIDPLLEVARACGVEVDVLVEGHPQPLDPSIDHAAYRVVQEALSNVIKHGGRSATARIHLSWFAERVSLDIRNVRGLAGSSPPSTLSGGLGLRGLAERVSLVGGSFEAGPAGDGGFIVRAELPFAPVSAGATMSIPAPGEGR